MQSLGVVDVDGGEISTSELMSHALSNSGLNQNPDDFTIKRGSAFINEYARTDSSGQRTDGGPSNPNHLLGCFPTLFPYGLGGFEVNWKMDVAYEAHTRWSMEYPDKRFRKDYLFPHLAFGVCQKREVCRSSVLQMNAASYEHQSQLLSTIKPADMVNASQEESQGKAFSNPAVKVLRQQLRAVRTRVKGTDESRQHVRSKIWGATLMFNPPNLWVTINPADMQDPIAQVFAGAEINLDNFLATAGPTAGQRSANIANDPYASAQFFHFMIKVIIHELFGFKKKATGNPERKKGILGHVQAYVGTVETQGRGSLHLHMMLWLQDAPTAQQMQDSLKTDAFRAKIKAYIASVIKADVQGLNTSQLNAMPKTTAPSYSRPLNPDTSSKEERSETETNLARTLQLHKCGEKTCLRKVKTRTVCRRRAPFCISEDDWILENGEWGCKRTAAYLNNFNSALMQAIRANHDIKLILNGIFTAKLTFYITCYATKKQQKSSNTSALLASTLAIKRPKDKRLRDLKKINKRLIQRCANSLTRNCEFSAPEVISYLMGWGDTYESHHYVSIYWDTLVASAIKEWPELASSPYAG